MNIPKHYEGREQAYVKHRLLESYLERLFMIVGWHSSEICYVDCFAGPWQEGSDDLSDTSIAISLKSMQGCAEKLKAMGKEVKFKALYIENDPIAFSKLEAFLKKEEWSDIETHCYNGNFFDLRAKLLEGCGSNAFTFFFIDPKGYTDVVEALTLKPLLERPQSEFLITFMYDFIVRAHTQPALEQQMSELFGEVPDTTGMEPKEREEHLVRLYRSKLKNVFLRDGKVPRSAYVKVLDPLKDRTKYGLVYLTRHPKGIIKFMEASEKLDLIQREVRNKTKQDMREAKSGQLELTVMLGTTNKTPDIQPIKDFWLEKLSTEEKRYGIIEFADILEETSWFPRDIQAALKELIKEGRVENLDAKRPRPKNVVNFDKNERLRKID
jgi:three-Cys-motif partner protein